MTPLLKMLAAAGILNIIMMGSTFSSLGVVLPHIRDSLHMDWSQAGFGFTLLALAAGTSGLLPAPLIRRIGARATLGLGVLAMFLSYLTLATATLPPAYYVGTLGLGLGFSLIGTIPALHILASWADHRRALVYGAYLACGGIGGALWPTLVYEVMKLLGGWRNYWWFMVALIALVGSLSLAILHERPVPASDSQNPAPATGFTLWQAMHTPQFYIITWGLTVHNLVATTVNAFTVSYLHMLGASAQVALITFSIQSGCHALFPLMMGGLARRLSVMQLVTLGLAMQTIGLVALAEGTNLPSFLVFAIGVGGGHGTMLLATTVALESYFGRKHFGQILGINQLFTTLSIIGPVAAGYVADKTGRFDTSFLACAALMLTATLAALTLHPPTKNLPLPPAGEGRGPSRSDGKGEGRRAKEHPAHPSSPPPGGEGQGGGLLGATAQISTQP